MAAAQIAEAGAEAEVEVAGLGNNWVGNFAGHSVEGTLVVQFEFEGTTEALEGLLLVEQMAQAGYTQQDAKAAEQKGIHNRFERTAPYSGLAWHRLLVEQHILC